MTDLQTNAPPTIGPLSPSMTAAASAFEPSGTDSSGDLKRVEPTVFAESHQTFAEFHEPYVGRYIELADAKAGVTFTIASGALGYFLSLDRVLALLKSPAISTEFCLALLTVGLLATTAGISFFVIAPRQGHSGDDIVFWGSVASLKNAAEFVSRVGGTSEGDLIRARLVHCYDLARVCRSKYVWLRRAMILGLLSLVVCFAALITL